MTAEDVPILPYAMVVGQDELKRALEIAYVVPEVKGVLATGQRGTAKSTTVRAFAKMVLKALPVTLPIGATDDRVLGGWNVEELLKGGSGTRDGLLLQAQKTGQGLLYIDEVNLLDDYLVNIILDAAAGEVLPIEREGIDEPNVPVKITLIGTMNPEEGNLRPQLLDRFGLVATITGDDSAKARLQILRNVLAFDAEREGHASAEIQAARQADTILGTKLEDARETAKGLVCSDHILKLCAQIAWTFRTAGHRGELCIANAARAAAAIDGDTRVRPGHVLAVTPMALVHRRASADTGGILPWTDEDAATLAALVTEF
ncbi:AAA family ATPase [Actinoplanes sp. L3-i22]|uniref:AAA family ATPase n=1 Tax=Actinoplanes sp. L3-i22 TaxID=2836373 RepID=UPI001C7517FF|nr:AAA family ATPase [Actinoplanes sp. L3-i22]BCY08787.1 magnesium chelatase [Actinoplanes sp. L3-i22]